MFPAYTVINGNTLTYFNGVLHSKPFPWHVSGAYGVWEGI